MFYTMTRYRRNRNRTEAYGNREKEVEYIVRNSMEVDGNVWNALETTVSYTARVRLTPTLTHVVTYELVTSDAEDDAMSADVICGSTYTLVTNMRSSLWIFRSFFVRFLKLALILDKLFFMGVKTAL